MQVLRNEKTPKHGPYRSDAMMRGKVLVVGAGGFIGAHIVRALLQEGYEVVCGGRDPSSLQSVFPHCSVMSIDFTETLGPSHWYSKLDGVEVIVNASGIFREQGHQTFSLIHEIGPITFFKAAQDMHVRRIIQLSALGADDEASTQFHMSKKQADDFLADQAMEWIILYPSLVYGFQERSAQFFKALAALPIMPLIGAGNQMVQPVCVDDLVKLIVRLVQPHSPSNFHLPVVGLESLTMKNLLLSLRQWLRLPPTFTFPIPYQMAFTIGRMGDVLGWKFLTSEAITMLDQSRPRYGQEVIDILGHPTLSFVQFLEEHPAQPQELRYARLYFLIPFLRISIASVWILAGLVTLFFFPMDLSEALLATVGIPDVMRTPLLNGTAIVDMALGMAMLCNWHLRLVGMLQITLIVGFSIIIVIWLPEFLIHPFGPITKNLPLAIATLGLILLDEQS